MDEVSSPVPRPNQWVSLATDSTVQLVYALQTEPAPLSVSLPDEDPLLASLEFVITNNQPSAAQVTSVAFTFQLGAAANALTAQPSNKIEWVVSDPVNWQVTPPSSTVTSGPAVFTLGPKTGSSVALQPGSAVNVQFYQIAVNQTVGTTTVNVKEIIGGQVGFTTFEVTKFPYGFYFEGLIATVPSGSTYVPVAQVDYDTSVTLLWNGSVADASAYKVFYATNKGQQTGTVKTLGEWVSPTLTRDTVFTVVVQATATGGQPLTLALSVAVAVQQPDVFANSLTAAGAATFDGDAVVSGVLTAASANVTGAASVAGVLTIGDAGSPSASPALSVAGDASVAGLTATSASITGSASVAGDTSIAGLTSTDTLNVGVSALLAQTTINGPLAVGGNVSAMGSPTFLHQQGTYQATTDGFLVGYVYYNGSYADLCVGLLWGSCNGYTLQAAGGNTVPYQSYMCNNPQSLMLPVPANRQFSIGWKFGSGKEPIFVFCWIPFGVGTVQQVSTAVLAAPDLPEVGDMGQTDRRNRRELLAELVEELLADESGEQLERLARALEKIDKKR